MEKNLRLVENRFTLPLKITRPPLDVYTGWNETTARKLGNITRFYYAPPQKLAEATREWQSWYESMPRATYFLGRKGVLLALAHFEETLFLSDEAVASHQFSLHVYSDVDRDCLKDFCSAAHVDHDTWSGATWLELDPDGRTETELFAAMNYRRISADGRIIMVKIAD